MKKFNRFILVDENGFPLRVTDIEEGWTPCWVCDGEGEVDGEDCPECDGEGVVRDYDYEEGGEP